jgi:predicted amidohydrolase
MGAELKENIKTACGQFNPVFGDTTGNINRICRMTEEAQADLIVFPELASSGYDFKNKDELKSLALDLHNGSEIEQLKQTAKVTDTYIVVGLAEKDGDKLYNSAILVMPDGEIHVYRKNHLFDREKLIFNPGDKRFRVVETPIGRIGLMICFDWIFPEAARLLSLGGAQIICHPSNLVLSFCQRAMFARSVENGVFTMTCNRIGTESHTDRALTFTGASQILGNRGEMLAQAGADTEEIISAEIEPIRADEKMITLNNHILNDRRTDLYKALL